MSNQTIKAEVANNILVAMSCYVGAEAMDILERIIGNEFVRVNMEEISTLPVAWKNSTAQRNQYIIQLFMIKKKNLKESTMDAYLRAVKRLILQIDKPLDQMDDTDIDFYLSQYERRNVSSGGEMNQASTVNNERRFISAFFTWMRKAKLIGENPVESTEPKKVAIKPIDYFRPEELAALRDYCKNIRQRAIVEVFRSTGARVGEIADIRIDQINMSNGDILIMGEKNDCYRTIYLDDDARYYLKKYLETRKDSSPYMFVSSRAPHGKMTTCAFRSVLKEIAGRAGLKTRVYPHKMRKTLGMNLKNKNVDLGYIQEVLGHKSPAVTAMYYAQSTPDTLRNVRIRMAA